MTGEENAVLWIEDQAQSFPLIKDILQEEGRQVEIVASAVDAEKVMESRTFQVVVADVLLPRGGSRMEGSPYLGLELLKKVPSGTRAVVVTLLSKKEFDRAAKTVQYEGHAGYFNKMELGPKLDEFIAALRGKKEEGGV